MRLKTWSDNSLIEGLASSLVKRERNILPGGLSHHKAAIDDL